MSGFSSDSSDPCSTRLSAEQSCPLCLASVTGCYFEEKKRQFCQCSRCSLVFVPEAQRLTPELEKAEYDLHENTLDDLGYRQFLKRFLDPVAELLQVDSMGLDFGCGPGPLLATMFRERGQRVSLYDHFYAPDKGVFDHTYDFITATEVVEHLHEPGRELQRLWQCLKPGGLLGVMTKLVIDREAFSGWHYKNDPTHVCFFSQASFRWLADRLGAELSFAGKDVILLRKP